MNKDWDAIDAEAEREGRALKNSFRRARFRDGRTKTSLVDQSHDYRNVEVGNILYRLNVIDGRKQ